MCGSEKKQCICLLYSRFQDCTSTLLLRVISRIEACHCINPSNSSTEELSLSLGVSRGAFHYSLAFHIIFSVLSISMPLLLSIADGPGLLWPTYINFAWAIIDPTLPLGLGMFALANRSSAKPVRASPTEVKAPDKNDSTIGADSLVTWQSRYKKQYVLWMCIGSYVTILKTSVRNKKGVGTRIETLAKV
jgi:hypothetical protein